ncbi:MAG: DUF4286 family protein [Chitinophagales bacterium]|nr:DUF4286 family protein [Chitinophagales bacterium]
MIIYNVTVKVDLGIHDEWVQWMKLEHIPEVLGTGYFHDHRMLRLLEQDESDGITYAIQYHAKDMADYLSYQREQAPRLQQAANERYKDRFVAFRTVMRVV